MERPQKVVAQKAILVKILQWFYLSFGLGIASSILWYKQVAVLESYNIPDIIVYLLVGSLAFYCLVLAVSFFTQNTNLLILALVLIFFTTIAALILFVIALPNAQTVISGDLPSCIKNLSLCSVKEGVVVASAILLSISIPALVLNIITIIGAVKAIAATD